MLNTEDLKKIYIHFGVPSQVDKALEEMTELSLELHRFKKSGYEFNDIASLREEIADVLIMVNQLMLIFSSKEEIKTIMDSKIERTKRLIENINITK